jgi:hypothetical protein
MRGLSRQLIGTQRSADADKTIFFGRSADRLLVKGISSRRSERNALSSMRKPFPKQCLLNKLFPFRCRREVEISRQIRRIENRAGELDKWLNY